MSDFADAPPPVLDPELADQLFAASSDAEHPELRAMLGDMLSDVSRRLDMLREEAASAVPATVCRELHQLKGNTSSFGFVRSAFHIARLEIEWDSLSADTRIRLLSAAIEDLHAGAAELVARHPYLAAR